MSEKAFTTFEAAKICHVTHHSIKNWIKQGLIRASRTPGGHYRILEGDLDTFREEYDMFPRDKGEERKRIMIVDDDPDALALLEKVLTDDGYELIKVSNATEVGLKSVQLVPDLILLDIMMPKLSWFEVCKKLKDDHQTRKIMILMVTALNELGDIERAVQAGTDDFLSKPVNKLELLKRVENMLKLKDVTDEVERLRQYITQMEDGSSVSS